MLDLRTAQPMLGSSFIERMTGKQYAVLKIGNETFTRHQLVTEAGTGNFLAARNLSKLVAQLELRTVRDLYHISPYELAGNHGVGTATLFVLMSIFEAKGLDIAKWMGKSGDVKTFSTLKHQVMRKDREAGKTEKRMIKAADRKRAHKRTDDYLSVKGAKKARSRAKKPPVEVATPIEAGAVS